MLPFRRTFESEKQHLQQLNTRLAQYLCRTKQLEQENAHLVAEINKLRQRRATTTGAAGLLEPKYKAEMRDLRRMVDQLSVEKSQAEVEREKLWRELQMIQSLCSEQTGVCTDISGELQGCAKELQVAHRTNTELQQRLLQLESECGAMEEAHRLEMERARRQVESRVVPIITQTYRGPAVVPAEELQEYALGLSEGWVQTFEMYQQKVADMEQAMKADQAMLSDLQREKMLYATQMDNLRKEAEKQGRLQMRLEDELMNMQETFRVDLSKYQMVVEQLERERNLMAKTIAEKTQEHQHLLKVKMDLGMEVAAYRALLEGERVSLEDAHRRVNQHQRERIIDIKKPAHPYTPRASMLTTRQHTDVRYTQPSPSLTRSPMVSSGSRSPSKVIPISVADRARYQSPPSRRDMISFSKARAAAAAPVSTTTPTTTAAAAAASAKDEQTRKHETHMSPSVRKTSEERTVKIKQVSTEESQISPSKSPTAETRSVRVVSPPMMSRCTEIETESQRELLDEMERDHGYGVKFEEEWKKERASEQKILEEIVEKAIRPAGLDAQVCSPGDSKVRYHVEKTEEENGTTKTQIVLESKVEEEVDFGEDSALDKLLSQGAKKVSLEDIEDTAAGSMIKNLFSDLQGAEILQNKSVNVQIIEEPVDSRSKYEVEVKEMSRSMQEPVDSRSKYEVEFEEMSRSIRKPVDSHRKYEVEDEEMSRSGPDQEPMDSHGKYDVEFEEMSRSIQKPVDSHSKYELEDEEMSRSIQEPVDSHGKYEVEFEEMSRSIRIPVDSHSKYEVEDEEMSRSGPDQEPVDSHGKYEVQFEEMSRSIQKPVDSHGKYEVEFEEMSRSIRKPVDSHSKYEVQFEEMSRSIRKPVDSHSKYEVEDEEMSRSGPDQEPVDSQGKYDVEFEEMSRSIRKPVDSHRKYEVEGEEMSRSTYREPSSTYYQIEELENVPYNDAKSFTTDADTSRDESVHVEDISRQSDSPYFSHDQESHEYFVSTPDDNLSESEEGGGITSYGHYGMVDDLSDEKYYQDGHIPLKTTIQKGGEEYKFLSDLKDGFPECIIEEEICVSPVVQESVLEFLREDSLEPKEQLKGALEKLQSSVSGPLKEELAFLTKISRESPENMAVNVTKVQQSSDNGTMTIVAELNVSQSLEDSGLLEAEDDLSEEQIMAALRSSNLEFDKAFQVGAGGGYRFSIDTTEDIAHGEESERVTDQRESVSEITEKHIKFGPSEKSFAFQMGSHSGVSSRQELMSETSESPEKISQEKRVATIYLDD